MNIIVIVLLISPSWFCMADVFTSTTSLGELIKTENSVVEALERSLEEIQKLRENLKSYKKRFVYHENTTEDFILKHVSNPTNSFTLIKRLYLDLGKMHDLSNQTFEHINNKLFHNQERLYPQKSDLLGIATLLRDLQVGYSLNLTEFVNGYIRGIKYREPLTAKEVFQLGKSICEVKYDNSCMNFLKEALSKWSGSEEISKIEIMQAISDAYYQSQNLTDSLEWDNRILAEEDFDDITTLLHKAQTLHALQNGYNAIEEDKDLSDLDEKDFYSDDLINNFHSLCNKEKELPEEIKSKLYCFYKYGKHPFLRLAPFKMEQLYLEPEVFLVRQIISDDESAALIENSKTRLTRSGVVLNNGTGGAINYRISSTAFYYPEETLPTKVLMRSMDITDLVNSSLDLQVTHYPPGGYYRPHYDVTLAENKQFMYYLGNRIVTVLYYLSDVEQGGGTAFPKLGIMVEPEKGSAVYWRNLHTSGEADKRTLHGGCPVLQGIKWVSNVWIHTKGQEEATPCGLEDIPESYDVTTLNRYLEENNGRSEVL